MRNKKRLLSFVFLFAIAIASFSQQFIIKGRLLDTDKEPIPFALLTIENEQDSTIRIKDRSDIDGFFAVVVPTKGMYTFVASFFSMQPILKQGLVVSDKSLDLGNVEMLTETVELEEVLIQATQSQVKLDIDKRVFNVSESIVNSGGNATDVLEDIPSVSVDVDGNVSLRGSENVTILINGKPSGLLGNDLSGLNQIQSSSIEKVEIITNPSSKHDAQGGVGIINIVLKKDHEKGMNGSFEVATGYPDKHQVSLNLNYRKKKFNVFTNMGADYKNTPGEGLSYQQFYNDATVSYYEKEFTRVRGGFGGNIQLGTDWFVNDKNTITLSSLYRKNTTDNSSTNTYSDYAVQKVLINRSVREDDEVGEKTLYEGNISHEKTFGKKDKKWTSTLKLMSNSGNENSIISQTYTHKQALKQFAETAESDWTFLAQTDYVQPFTENGKIEMGLKSVTHVVGNEFVIEQENSSGERTILPAFNNDFEYSEKIQAAYVQYGKKVNKWSYQLGLRSEYSDINVLLRKTNESNNRTYFNLFPSAFVSTELDSNSTLQASYSRRISRPRSRYFLPFYNYSDNRNIRTGNPNLQPEYTNSFDVGYLRYLDKGSFLSSVYYRNTPNSIQRITTSDSLGITQTLPINMAVENALGVELSINYALAKWWKASGNLNVFNTSVKGSYGEYELNRSALGMSVNLSSKFQVDKKTVFQLSGRYMSPQNNSQGYRKSMLMTDVALSHEVFKKKGMVVFSVKDVFNSRRWRNVVDTEDYYLESDYLGRKRQFVLSFNYQFNQPKKKGKDKSQRSGGTMEDEEF